MTAEQIAKTLGGRKVGSSWIARCLTHDDREPSLSVRDGANGMILVRCHAGCNQREVIAALKARGLWDSRIHPHPHPASQRNVREPRRAQEQSDRTAAALAIWKSSITAVDTQVETYLAARGLTLPVPSSLRFHHGLKHPAGGLWPCMLALVASSTNCTPQAIHRTFLACDGSGKAPVQPSKMMLGPCRGGAVHLADHSNLLMVGEGIETCLAAMLATGLPAWAALSTSGLRALNLPATVREVIILADGDDAGEVAAQDGARRWVLEGRRVRIARPPSGMDFNDLLLADREKLT